MRIEYLSVSLARTTSGPFSARRITNNVFNFLHFLSIVVHHSDFIRPFILVFQFLLLISFFPFLGIFLLSCFSFFPSFLLLFDFALLYQFIMQSIDFLYNLALVLFKP